MIQINRSLPLNPAGLHAGLKWLVKRKNERSVAITQIDPAKIYVPEMFRPGELTITHQENLKRLEESSCVPLDAQVGQTFYHRPYLIPRALMRYRSLHFYGTVLKKYGNNAEYFLSLVYLGRSWQRVITSFSADFYDDHEGAVCFPE